VVSTFAKTNAGTSLANWLILISGVLPMVSSTLLKTLMGVFFTKLAIKGTRSLS
jgi:hypothetical protein